MTLLEVHVTRRRHKLIVAGGIITCGIITVCWPEMYHVNGVLGTTINLVWLLVDPEPQ